MSEDNQNRNTRSRNNSGRSNNNNNRNQNRNGGNGGGGNNRNNRNGGGNRGGNGGGGNKASQQRNELQPSHGRRSKAKPLTLWQKILKAVGLYKDPAEKKKSAGGNKPQNKPTPHHKNGRVAGGGRVENKGGGNKRGPRDAKKDNSRERNDRRDTPNGGTPKVETPRLYVGNLSYDAAEHDLEELFKGIGSVRNVELVYNRHTHKSKGYGFISMANVEEAERAVEVLHDQPFMGRKMIVNGARSKGPADNSDSEERPRRNTRNSDRKPTERKSSDDGIPAEEEVHSLAPKED